MVSPLILTNSWCIDTAAVFSESSTTPLPVMSVGSGRVLAVALSSYWSPLFCWFVVVEWTGKPSLHQLYQWQYVLSVVVVVLVNIAVSLGVCLSVALWYDFTKNRSTIMHFSPVGSPETLVFTSVKTLCTFEGSPPAKQFSTDILIPTFKKTVLFNVGQELLLEWCHHILNSCL